MSCLARPGNRVEAPQFLAAGRIEGRDEAADAEVAAGGTDDQLVLDDLRRDGESVAGFGPRAGDGDIPERPSALRIDREEMAVDGAHEQTLAQDRDTAVHASAAGPRLLRGFVAVGPEDAARGAVDRDDVVGRLDGVEHAVHGERRRFEFLERLGLEHPLQFQVLHVGRRDLRERRVTPAEHVARVAEPVVGLRGGAHDAVEGDLRTQRRVRRADNQQHDRARNGEQASGHRGPRRVVRYVTMSAISCVSSVPREEGIGDVLRTVNSRRLARSNARSFSALSSICTEKVLWLSRRPVTTVPVLVTARAKR